MLGVETTTKGGFLKKDEARKKVVELSEKYGLAVDPDGKDRKYHRGYAAENGNPENAVS